MSRIEGGKPRLVNVGLEMIAGIAGIVVPDLALQETDFVEHLFRQAWFMIGKPFWVVEGAMNACHFAAFSSEEPRCPAVTNR